MKKRFNDTGLCIPERHYMADVSGKIQAILRLVEDGSYFVINRPRQYGKTTTLFLLERELARREAYLPVFLSFEGFGTSVYECEQSFIKAFQGELCQIFERAGLVELASFFDKTGEMTTLHEFGGWLSKLIEASQKPIVLMIDEVDKSSNHQLFLDFLALLRAKFLSAAQGKEMTFHSVILAGVHDIKTLKLKIRPDDERRYNSPWNIAVDFTIDLSLTPPEIKSMLTDYSAQTGVTMDRAQMAARLHQFTSGYPFLVSKLCKIIAEELLPADGRAWLPEYLDQAVNRLLQTQNTNFDSLIKNLENHPDLYQLVEKIVIFGEEIAYSQYGGQTLDLGMLYGILTRRGYRVDIHNQIYREQIYTYMATNWRVQTLLGSRLNDYALQEHYALPDGGLDMTKLLLKFQEFMKAEYSQRDRDFIERHGRLIFLAFLKPILNGRGFDFKEPQISEEKRLDVVITYNAHKYIVELKLWRGEAAHQRGLAQLRDYLRRANLTTGYLVIFDLTQSGQKTWQQAQLRVDDADMTAVWV